MKHSRKAPGSPIRNPRRSSESLDREVDNAAERRMCAACYVDRDFREQALREVFTERSRRVAPSYGFDLLAVLGHAWRAWRLEIACQILITVVLAAAAVLVPASAILVVSLLALWYVLRGFGGVAVDLLHYFRRRSSAVEVERLRLRFKTLLYALVGAGLLALAAALDLILSDNIWLDIQGPWPTRGGLLPSALTLAALIGLTVGFSTCTRMTVNRLSADRFTRPSRDSGRYRIVRRQQEHPFTVYDGFEPFVGSGVAVRTWSFAQRLVRAKSLGTEGDREFRTPPFTTKELVLRMRKRITRLAHEPNPETRLPGLKVRDSIFIQGFHAEPFRDVLAESPDSSIIGERVAAIMADPSDATPANRHDVARHFLACQVDTWGGEVVTTVFVHVSLQGRTLYIEFSTYALLPTREEYRLMDEVGGGGASAVLRYVAKELGHLPERIYPRDLRHAPGLAWAALLARQDGTVKPRRNINIGAKMSLREAAATSYDGNYFQYRDVYKYSKIIERRLLGTVGDFLKKRGVDNTEFWQRANGILNQGVIISGGRDVTVTDSTVGNEVRVDMQPAGTGEPAS